jgi:hypothetical protein
MGVLEKLMFWKRDETPEHVDGFDVDGCFTLPGAEQVPGAEQIPGAEQLRSTDLPLADVQPDPATAEPPAEHG